MKTNKYKLAKQVAMTRACVCVCLCVCQGHGRQSRVLRVLLLWVSRAAPARTSGFFANPWQVKRRRANRVKDAHGGEGV